MFYVSLCAAARRALIFTVYVPRRLLNYLISRLNQAYLTAAKGVAQNLHVFHLYTSLLLKIHPEFNMSLSGRLAEA
jgi:hypothetical protein